MVQYLERYRSASHITAAFIYISFCTSRLKIKIPYSVQYCPVKYTKAQQRMCSCVSVYQTHDLTYLIEQVNAHLHL